MSTSKQWRLQVSHVHPQPPISSPNNQQAGTANPSSHARRDFLKLFAASLLGMSMPDIPLLFDDHLQMLLLETGTGLAPDELSKLSQGERQNLPHPRQGRVNTTSPPTSVPTATWRLAIQPTTATTCQAYPG